MKRMGLAVSQLHSMTEFPELIRILPHSPKFRLFSYQSHLPSRSPKPRLMSAHLEFADSPINISSSPPPRRFLSPVILLWLVNQIFTRFLRLHTGNTWLAMIVSPGSGSHVSMSHSAGASHSSIATRDLGVHYELAQLREQCDILQAENTGVKTENSALRERIDALT